MRKVLIVDDEKLIRLGVKTMIERKSEDHYEIFLASNGLEALEIVSKEKIDIIITDIRMPEMDGIDFINKLQKFDTKPAIMILSGYDDFNYAVQAMKCGAHNYLLKPVKREELYESLDKIEKALKISEIAENSRLLDSVQMDDYIAAELKNIFLSINISEAEVESIGKKLKLDILNGEYYLGLMIKEEESGSDRGIIGETYSSNELNIILERYMQDFQNRNFKIFPCCGALVIITGDIKDFEDIKQMYSTDDDSRFHIGFSNKVQGVRSLKRSFDQAEEALKYRIYPNYHGNTIIKYPDIQNKIKEYKIDLDKIEKLHNMLGTDRENEIESLLEELFNESRFKSFSISYLEETNKSINKLVLSEIETKIFLYEEDMLKKFQRFKDIYNFNSFKHYYHELKAFIISINEYIKTMKEIYGNRDKIDRAINYINNNYHKDINLATVSNEVSLNYSYFSQIFKEHVGDNFVSYLKKVRINKAKEILRSDESKVYEVGKMVGYEDSKQFAKHFRSVTGVSPIEYKKSLLKDTSITYDSDNK